MGSSHSAAKSNFFSAATFAGMGRPECDLLSCLSPVPPTREGYGHAYPDQVGGHNLVCPLSKNLVPVPVRDVLATTVVGVSLVDTGPPRTSPVGSEWSGRESVMAVDRFCRNAVGPPEWECEAMGSVVWVQCATSAECVIKSTDSRVLRHGHNFVLGHTV